MWFPLPNSIYSMNNDGFRLIAEIFCPLSPLLPGKALPYHHKLSPALPPTDLAVWRRLWLIQVDERQETNTKYSDKVYNPYLGVAE